MWCKIQTGVGSPGKLWTGSDLSDSVGKVARVELVEFRSSESGASTRRLFITDTRDDAPEGVYVPTLRICTGGVGSLAPHYAQVTRERGDEPRMQNPDHEWQLPLVVWNWSGRIGGYAILDPVSVESGYVRADELNSTLPGFAWLTVYSGSSLSEHIMVRTKDEGYGTMVDRQHVLPVHRVVTSLLAPPERPEGRVRSAIRREFGEWSEDASGTCWLLRGASVLGPFRVGGEPIPAFEPSDRLFLVGPDRTLLEMEGGLPSDGEVGSEQTLTFKQV